MRSVQYIESATEITSSNIYDDQTQDKPSTYYLKKIQQHAKKRLTKKLTFLFKNHWYSKQVLYRRHKCILIKNSFTVH